MTKEFKKIPKVSELMWILGTVLMSLGVCLTKKADLGVSMIAAPTFIIQEALGSLSPFFSVGVTEYLLQGIILIILIAVVRRFDWRFLLCFAAAVIYGYCLDFWMWALGSDPFSSVALRWIMLLVGDVTVALSVSCFFHTYLPLQIHELFVSEVSAKFSVRVPKIKWIYDLCCLALSVILAFTLFGDVRDFDFGKIYETSFHSIGLATLITTFINAPIIKFWGFVLDKTVNPSPLLPRARKLLARKPWQEKKITVAGVTVKVNLKENEPFVIGITGHRNPSDAIAADLKNTVKTVIADIKAQISSPVEMLNGLAQGADILCAEAAEEEAVPLNAILPCDVAKYKDSFDNGEENKLYELLEKSKSTVIAPDVEKRFDKLGISRESYEYRQLGIYIVEHCNVLIALWDGALPAEKYGCGTADVVFLALKRGNPIIKPRPTVIHVTTQRANQPAREVTVRRLTGKQFRL